MTSSTRVTLDASGQVTVADGGIRTFGTVSEFVQYLRTEYRALSADQLRCCGSICLFLALEQYGEQAAGVSVLSNAEKALDSFYLHTGDNSADTELDAGVAALKSHLFDDRHMPSGYLRRSAYQFCVDCLRCLSRPGH